jgi:hypothetical protein
MLPKSGYRFSEKIMLKQEHDPEKWIPVFGKDHAQTKEAERDGDSTNNHPALDHEIPAHG